MRRGATESVDLGVEEEALFAVVAAAVEPGPGVDSPDARGHGEEGPNNEHEQDRHSLSLVPFTPARRPIQVSWNVHDPGPR